MNDETAGKKKTVLVVLGLMLGMAAFGVMFVLATIDRRRKNDLPPLPKHHHAGELRLLGHVPAKCSVLGALHLRELRYEAATKSLLDAPRPEMVEAILGNLERWTGLKSSAIDYVALGVMDLPESPTLYLLVQTAVRFEPAELVRKAGKEETHRGKPMSRFPLEGKGGNGRLWTFSDRVFAVVLRGESGANEDLDAIPLTPRISLEGSADPLRQAILHRLDGRSLMWFAALTGPAPAEWAPLLGLRSEMTKLPAQVIAAGLFPQEQIALVGQAFGGAPDRVKKLEEAIREVKLPKDLTLKAEIPPTDAKDADQWMSFQLRGSVEAVRELLKP
ncbi:MAG: hypothetical protein K2X38_18960 [Gemmataceae bacterium]|nr:hypothetical protein [Gemmataceae bacterium]